MNVLKLLFTVNLYWFFFLQGFEGIEYLVIPVDNATLTEFTEQHESSVWEDAFGRRFMELRYMADISNKGRNLKFWERKKSINDTMYSCNWLYLFINWFDMQIKVYFDSKNSFILYLYIKISYETFLLFFCHKQWALCLANQSIRSAWT